MIVILILQTLTLPNIFLVGLTTSHLDALVSVEIIPQQKGTRFVRDIFTKYYLISSQISNIYR